MTEEEKEKRPQVIDYFEKDSLDVDFASYQLALNQYIDYLESKADEQVKKERAKHILDRMDWVNEGVKMALEDANIKEICTSFFYHWYNAKGNNTEQGFDEWWKTRESISKLRKG